MKRHATAVWQGDLKQGGGTVESQSGVLHGHRYSFASRFEDENPSAATNPEELIAAAHAGCYAMQLSAFLAENGTPAERLEAKAVVELVPGKGITESALELTAKVPGIEEAAFEELAEKAKRECPVSKALGSIDVRLQTNLE